MKSIQIQTNNFNNNIIILFIITLYLIGFEGKAAWIQTGPEGGSFFIKENNGILYSTNAIGLYKSTDNGLNWNRVSTFTGFTMNDLIFTSNKIIASTNKGIFYSIDGGINWVSSNQGMQNNDTTGIGSFFVYHVSNNRIITSVISGTYFSDNNGQNWSISTGGAPFASVVQTSSNLIGSDAVNIYISNDNGTTWQPTSNTGISPSDLSQIVNLVYLNNAVYASGYGIGVYKSSDNGNTWQANNNGMTGVFYGNLLQFNNKLYKGLYQQGLYEYNITNNIWTLSTFAQNSVNAIITGYNNGRYFGGVTLLHDDLMYSDNNGQTWQNTNGIKIMNVRKLSASDNFYSLGDLGGFLLDTIQLEFNRNTVIA